MKNMEPGSRGRKLVSRKYSINYVSTIQEIKINFNSKWNTHENTKMARVLVYVSRDRVEMVRNEQIEALF